MEKKRNKKPVFSAEEQAELNRSWDEFAGEIREKLTGGKLDKPEACAIGLTIDMACRDAKTDYITISMMELGIELVKFLSAEGGEREKASAQEAIEQYRHDIAEVQKNAVDPAAEKLAQVAADAEKQKGRAEREHVHAEAQGIFATCTVESILNTPMVASLPNF